MKIKVKLRDLIVLGFLLVLFRLYVFKFAYLLVIPGFVISSIIMKKGFKETLLLSIPFSLVFYVLPYFLITRAGVSINYLLYLLIPLLLLIYYLVVKKPLVSFSRKVNLVNLSLTIIILSIFTVIFRPYSFSGSLPLTAGSNGFNTLLDLKQGIINQGRVPSWSDNIYSANHYFYTYPPLAQLSAALLLITPTESLALTYTMTFSFMILYLLFASYEFLRKLGLSNYSSLLALIPLASLPLIVGELTYAGNLTSSFMYALYPLVLYSLFSLFEKKSSQELMAYGVVFAAFFLSYHYISFFVVMASMPLFLVSLIIKSKHRRLILKNFLIFFLIAGGFIFSWMIRYFCMGDSVILVAHEGNWNKPLNSLAEFLEHITYMGSDIGKAVVSFTPVFFYLGVITSFLIFQYKKKKLVIDSKDLLLFTYFLATIFLMIMEVFPILRGVIPLRSNYYKVFRYWIILAPLLAFGLGRLADNLLAWNKKLKPPLIIIFLVMFSGMIGFSAVNASSWLRENAIIDESRFKGVYEVINPDEGRLVIYGGFGPALIPTFNRWTSASMFGGYNFQRHSTRLIYNRVILPVTSASMDFIKDEASPVMAYNIYQKSWTNTLVFFSCSENGLKALNKTVRYPLYNVLVNSECLTILSPVNKSSYASMVVLSKVVDSNKSMIIEEVMNKPGGYALVFTEDDLDIDYTNQVNDSNINDYVLNSTRLIHNKVSDTRINVKPRDEGFVLVKEPFFPNWRAYQDGRAIKVFPSYHGYILLKSLSNAPITLVLQPHYSEIIGLVIYLALLVLMALWLTR